MIPLVLPLYPHVWTNPSKILVHLQGAKMKPVCPQSYPGRGAFSLWKWAEHFQDLRLKHQNISKRTKYVRRDFTIKDKNLIYPIGSMVLVYMLTFTINIYHTLPYMDPMGTVWWLLDEKRLCRGTSPTSPPVVAACGSAERPCRWGSGDL